MRRLPAPVLPGAPKPPNAPPRLTDSPKLGDDKLPTGVPRFTWLKRFWKLIEAVRLYFFSLAAPPPAPCGPAGPIAAVLAPAPGAGPPGPPAGVAAVCPPGFAAAALPRWIAPNAKARLMRRLTTKAPGAC